MRLPALLLPLGALMAFAPATLDADDAAAKKGARTTREIVLYGHTFPSDVVLAIDASGSMIGQPYAIAVREAMRVAAQATDDGRVRFYTFGRKLHAEGQGWIKLPDEEALALAKDFLLHDAPTPARNTDMVGALEQILALPESPIGVVVFTDGEPDDLGTAASAILAANGRRPTPAILGFVTINPEREGADALGRQIAQETGGGYVRVRIK